MCPGWVSDHSARLGINGWKLNCTRWELTSIYCLLPPPPPPLPSLLVWWAVRTPPITIMLSAVSCWWRTETLFYLVLVCNFIAFISEWVDNHSECWEEKNKIIKSDCMISSLIMQGAQNSQQAWNETTQAFLFHPGQTKALSCITDLDLLPIMP